MPSMYIVDWEGHPEVAEMIRLQKAGVRPSGDYALSPMSEGEDKEGEGDKQQPAGLDSSASEREEEGEEWTSCSEFKPNI